MPKKNEYTISLKHDGPAARETRNSIADQVSNFLSSGGEIDQIPSGVSGQISLGEKARLAREEQLQKEQGLQTSEQIEQAATESGEQTSEQTNQPATESGEQTSEQTNQPATDSGEQTSEQTNQFTAESGEKSEPALQTSEES